MIADVNVFWPAIVCACVDIRPVAPDPAIGIFSVCVDPDDENAGTVPE